MSLSKVSDVARSMPQFGLPYTLIAIPMMILPGGYTPPESMPSFLRIVLQGSPATHGAVSPGHSVRRRRRHGTRCSRGVAGIDLPVQSLAPAVKQPTGANVDV